MRTRLVAIDPYEFPAIHAVDAIVGLIRAGELDIAESALVGQAEAMITDGNFTAARAIVEIVLRLNSLEFDTRQMAAAEELLSALQPNVSLPTSPVIAVAVE